MLQEALLRAWERWPSDGIPERPAAWLYTVACRSALDQLKHLAMRRRVGPALESALEDAIETDVDAATFDDELLKLIFTCCHPALALEAQVALTLRTLMDLSVDEIARAFLVTADTMEQRLTRAKRKIRDAGIPWEVPRGSELDARLAGVLVVLYLAFNQGHSPTAGDEVVNRTLCREAIRTTRSLVRLLRGHAEASALLALLLLLDAHAEARTGADGNLVLLEDQDRTRWDRRAIDEGLVLLEKALALRQPPGPFQVQAAIAAVHAEAERFEVTDWAQIVALYDHLVKLTDSDVVRVNRAVAIGMERSPDEGLEALAAIGSTDELARYQPFHAARAGLLFRAGRSGEALAAYRAAVAGERNGAVRRFFEKRIEALSR